MLDINTIDAFGCGPFTGNPAAVCLLDREASEKWMQSLGAEMNLADTAFLVPREDGYSLRWFTPKIEVSLCGHATLASAHFLWETGRLSGDQVARFHTRAGLLIAMKLPDGSIRLDFPLRPVSPCPSVPGLAEALGVAIVSLWSYTDCLVAETSSEASVASAAPSMQLLRAALAASPVSVHGVVLTSAAETAGVDFVSRFFAPLAGIDEDPVTGSAHCGHVVCVCVCVLWTCVR